MAIRTNTNPRQMDLQPEMRTLLMRNGMQAHLVAVGSGYQLVVQGHDSPPLTYSITEKQMLALTDWGTNTANRKAYNVFTSIVGNDFYMPKDFVHARNANGRVAMGLHGYRIGIGEYGRMGRMGMPPPFLGWTPRNQWGFHLRRVGGQLFYHGPSVVPERRDGRMKPGELQSGGYGFYYKGHSPQEQSQGQRRGIAPQTDVLEQLQLVITPAITLPRSQEPAKGYGELITSPVYFSNEKWQECLSSHGIIIDAEAKTLTVQSESIRADMRYDLLDEEVGMLTSNDIEAVSVDQRLEVLNHVIKDDFADAVTKEMLDSERRIGIALHPEVQQDLEERVQREQEALQPQERALQQEDTIGNDRILGIIDGKDLTVENGNKGWYKEGAHGKEVQVDEIFVHPSESEGKYRMTAVIDGQIVSHEITQKQYDKFLAVDDFHRMKLFSKIFSEVDMKTRPEAHAGLGTRIFAALAAGAVAVSEVVHNLGHHHGPELYGEHFCGPPRPYFKPGVDSPMDVAARNFEAQMNAVASDMRMGR